MERISKSHDFAVRALNKERRTARFIASTANPDRHGDIVEQSWKLDAYRNNPLVLYAHNSSALFAGPAATLPIGKANAKQ